MSLWIAIDKKTEECFFYDDFAKMASECEADPADIISQLKKTGRFDSEDDEITIIEANPPDRVWEEN
jgi:hypothetical protein